MNPRSRLLVATVSTALVGYVAAGSLVGLVRSDSSYSQLSVFNEVVHIIGEAYVEPVNMDRALNTANQGLTEALDGDSAYLDAEDFKAYQQSASREAEGETGLTLTRRFAFLMVVSVRANSPAERAGLRTGDIVKTIDGRHSRSIPVAVGERLLRGAPGSVVKLAVMRSRTEPAEFSLVRERLVPVPASARLLEPGLGYLRVTEFSSQTVDEVRAGLELLTRDGAKQLVLDLRRAATGSPLQAVAVAELFIKQGVITKLTGRKQPEQVWSADPRKLAWEGPMAALIDTGTAGAGEVLAAALLDAGRATLVGERTFGRAGVQKAIPLPEGGLVLTVAKYLSPKGNPIHGKGVEPNEAVAAPRPKDDDDDDADPVAAPVPAAADPILDKAVQILKGGPTTTKKAA
jgi:carboxyl-terminal processing protease